MLKLLGFIAVAATLFCFSGMEVVDTGYRGVKVRFGQVVSEKPLTEGLYFYKPFVEKIVEMDVRTIAYQNNTVTYTKDIQQADITYSLNFNLNPDYVATMYQTVGYQWQDKIVKPIIDSTIKQVMGTYEAAPLIANRDKARTLMFDTMVKQLADKGVILTNLQISNIDYSDAFENAVEAKVTATQRAAEAQNKTVQVEEEAKQRIISAKAEAESMAIRSQALSQNQNLVQYEAVQKWDGHLPQYSLGGATPFINIK